MFDATIPFRLGESPMALTTATFPGEDATSIILDHVEVARVDRRPDEDDDAFAGRLAETVGVVKATAERVGLVAV